MIRSHSPPLFVDALPPDPYDGQEIYFQADAGVVWHLRYNASISDVYKWEYLGGPPLLGGFKSSAALTSSTAWRLDNGTQLPVPMAGWYDVTIDADLYNTTANCYAQAGITPPGVATPPSSSIISVLDAGNGYTSISCSATARMLTAVGNFYIRYRQQSGGTANLRDRKLFARPVRLG